MIFDRGQIVETNSDTYDDSGIMEYEIYRYNNGKLVEIESPIP